MKKTRTTINPSQVFQSILRQAEGQLLHDSRSAAAAFQQTGIRGDERAAALRRFLNEHLPSTFATGKGEAIDFGDRRTGQLDLFIYDRATAAPIRDGAENALIPAEALYAVIEVKSILSQDEMDKCAKAAAKVRSLRPFKRQFSAPPRNGAESDGCRCPYIVFAYTSDLSIENWAQKEFDRVKKAVEAVDGQVDLIDRVTVLDRGMLRPQEAKARIPDETTGIFLDFYVHLIAFLMRERRRRPAIDWIAYTSKSKWLKLQ